MREYNERWRIGMRIDWYTKGVLTVIALLLGMIAIRPYVSPDAVAHAQGPFAGVQFSGNAFFDSRTGDVYFYDGRNLEYHRRLTKLGAQEVDLK
jgi:hypothetical protein